MKNFFHSLPWKRILLIAGPVVFILAAAVIAGKVLDARTQRLDREAVESAAMQHQLESVLPSPTPTPVQTADPEATPAPIALMLNASSAEEDMTVTVSDCSGNPLSGYIFNIKLTFPDGGERQYNTDTEGKIYISSLVPGLYRITLSPTVGFTSPEAVSCDVKERYAYAPIANISEQATVTAVEDAPVDEVIPPSAEAESIEPDVIITSQATEEAVQQAEDSSDGDVSIVITGGTSPEEASPVQGEVHTSWKYGYYTGPGGNILNADGTESSVMPVLENGKLSYGLKKIVTYLNSDGQIISYDDIGDDWSEGVDYYVEESAEYITLILGEGQPNPEYMITAAEVQEAISVNVGWHEENGKLYYFDSAGSRVHGLKNIDGKLYFFDENGVKCSHLGVDVSYWNHDINWYSVSSYGIDFAIVRVGYRGYESGKLYEDGNSYKEMASGGCYLQEAKANGLAVGAYFYSSAVNTNEAVEEASLAIEVIQKSGISMDYPVYIDMEDSGMFPYGRADQLTPEERTEIVNAFCETISAAGYRPGLYVSERYLRYRLNYEALTDCNIWLASYTDYFTRPAGTYYNIWQSTAGAKVKGIAGSCDLNIIF